jgi:hypothetical protein
MVDLQFRDIVIESRETRTVEDGALVNRGWRARCKSCSTVHEVDVSEFDVPVTTFSDGTRHIPIDADVFQFVAEMRAWNCCHEGAEPYDGFPDEPDTPYGIELGSVQ